MLLLAMMLPAMMLPAMMLPATLLLGGCEYHAASEGREAMQREKARATAPDQVSEDARFFIYEEDQPRALVEAGRMERYEREDSTYTLLRSRARRDTAPRDTAPRRTVATPDTAMRGNAATRSSNAATRGVEADGATEDTTGRVTARIFDRARGADRDDPSVTATIRADRIVYHDNERRFDARGRVVVTTAAGKRLESEHLAWLEDERRIATPGFVHITTPTDRIQGYGLRADENLDTYQLRRVTGQVTVEDAP